MVSMQADNRLTASGPDQRTFRLKEHVSKLFPHEGCFARKFRQFDGGGTKRGLCRVNTDPVAGKDRGVNPVKPGITGKKRHFKLARIEFCQGVLNPGLPEKA
jgi:hypothetical protein